MHVVCGDNLRADIVGELYKQRQNALFLVKPVVLNFDIKIFAEDIFEIERKFLRPLVVVGKQPSRNAARDARRKAYYPLGMLL